MTKRRWLIAVLNAAGSGDVALLPWSRGADRARRKSGARARALAD